MGDVAALADLFAAEMDTDYVKLRLDVVDTDACRKFHIDYVTARLICTYRGPGTQYGIETVQGDPAPIHEVPTGSPIILRGRNWMGDAPSGILHRSPPIDGTGTTRLVLVLDKAKGPEDASCGCGAAH